MRPRPSHTLSQRLRGGVFAILAGTMAVTLVVPAQPAHAQFNNFGGGGRNGLQFGMPGGYYGGGGGRTTVAEIGFNGAAGGNILGCSGVGIFDFMQTTFNVSDIVDQLKTNMQTMMAKTLLTTVMSVPQISAIFDTLNAFGNAKFDLFQQSCDMSTIRKEAKEIFLKNCETGVGGSAKSPEQCRTDWDKGANFIKDSGAMKALNNLICQKENVGETARGIACPAGGACALMALMPQMRINLGGNGLNCRTSMAYGARPAPISISGLFGANVEHTAGRVMTSYQDRMAQAEEGKTLSQLKNAARDADAHCAAKPADCEGTDKQVSVNNRQVSPFLVASRPLVSVRFAGDDAPVEDKNAILEKFKSYMACPNPEKSRAMGRVNMYLANLSSSGEGGSYAGSDMSDAFDTKGMEQTLSSNLGGVYKNDLKLFAQLVDVATKCTLNDNNFLDPNLRIALMDGPDAQDTVTAEAKSSAMVWSYLITRAVGQFTIDNAKLIAAQMATKSTPKPETAVDKTNPKDQQAGTQQENVGAEESSKAFNEMIEGLRNELARLKDTIETSKDWARVRSRIISKQYAQQDI